MRARPVPPGPSSLAALRNMAAGGSLRRVPGFLARVAERYGPIASWRMPQGRFWFVDDAALIETVLTASGYDVVKGRGLQRMRRLLGHGLLTSDEPLHLKQRRLVQPAFHRERIAGYAATMIETAGRTGAALRPGETIAVDALMNRLALRIAAATLFSAESTIRPMRSAGASPTPWPPFPPRSRRSASCSTTSRSTPRPAASAPPARGSTGSSSG